MTAARIHEEFALARRRAALSIVVNALLAMIKGAAGVAAGSAALIGDAVHSATDVFASASAYLGLWAAGKKHPSFPYGFYKAESIASLLIAASIIFTAYKLAQHALLVSPTHLPRLHLALPATLFSLAIATVFGVFQLGAGKRLRSPALIADAKDYLADSLSTVAVLVGLLAGMAGLEADRWAAAVVALVIFKAGGELLLNAGRDLLDAAMDRDTERAIIKTVERRPRVKEVCGFLSRKAGGRYIIELDVILQTRSQEVADRVAGQLEEEILQSFAGVVMARVRARHGRPDRLRCITPVVAPRGAMSPHLGKAPWFMLEIIDTATGKVCGREYIENPHLAATAKKGLLVGSLLLRYKPDQVKTMESKESTVFVILKGAGVEVITVA